MLFSHVLYLTHISELVEFCPKKKKHIPWEVPKKKNIRNCHAGFGKGEANEAHHLVVSAEYTKNAEISGETLNFSYLASPIAKLLFFPPQFCGAWTRFDIHHLCIRSG